MSEEPEQDGNPYAPSTSLDDGKHTVTFAAGDDLPPICLGCGATEGVKRRWHDLGWMPATTYAGIPLGAIPFFVLIVLVRKTAKTRLPLCADCHGAWVDETFARGGMVVGGSIATIATFLALSEGAPLAAGVIAVVSLAVIALIKQRYLPADRLRLCRIEDGPFVTMGGVHPEAAEAIAETQGEEDE